ncbi:MAG: hypothetical protein GVY06_07990 [Alphaproteobacteria bacterium]|jgi:predicted nuclease of predicted toxin-antitoxin system|nr:hypothetical protein [Alphaproteobacteria bacterium]
MILWVDQNLPPVLAEWLRAKGHDAQHVRGLGLDQADDIGIATNAMAAGATIISKDDDFAFKGPPPTVLVRIGNVTNPKLISRFEAVWETIEAALEAGETLIEVF